MLLENCYIEVERYLDCILKSKLGPTFKHRLATKKALSCMTVDSHCIVLCFIVVHM